jgi:hypothetical protein
MKLMIGDRGTGKSTELVKWLLEKPDDRVILTCSEEMAKHLQGMVREASTGPLVKSNLGTETQRKLDLMVMSFRSRARLEGRKVEVAVDDLEQVLWQLLHTEIDLATMTVDQLAVPRCGDIVTELGDGREWARS